MSCHAHGTFEVQITADPPDDTGIGRMAITKTWAGDLSGSGHGVMLSAGDPAEQRAGYVALEMVVGSLGDRWGSFALQQLGVMRPGEQDLTYLVVPGSGTGELSGIEGALELAIDDEGTHTYDLSYTLP